MIFLIVLCDVRCNVLHVLPHQESLFLPRFPLKPCSNIKLCIMCSLTFHQRTRLNYCVHTHTKMVAFLHAVYELINDEQTCLGHAH